MKIYVITSYDYGKRLRISSASWWRDSLTHFRVYILDDLNNSLNSRFTGKFCEWKMNGAKGKLCVSWELNNVLLDLYSWNFASSPKNFYLSWSHFSRSRLRFFIFVLFRYSWKIYRNTCSPWQQEDRIRNRILAAAKVLRVTRRRTACLIPPPCCLFLLFENIFGVGMIKRSCCWCFTFTSDSDAVCSMVKSCWMKR